MLLLACLAPCLPAQEPPQHFVFHVYVDPIFGDNALATIFNPGTIDPVAGPNPMPLDTHPEVRVPQPITGYIQHAPYSFRTLSKADGALSYVQAVFPTLPWQHPGGRSVDYVVIHCLPGLYGVHFPNQENIDLGSRLRFNGEVLPIVLRQPRVSLQGTSALDTVFDGRQQPTAVFRIESPNIQTQLVDAFIDSITVRGANSMDADPPIAPGAGAGIYFGGPDAFTQVSISNCFIYGNTVGIALDHASEPSKSPAFHQPWIVNNTIADNEIGVWIGDRNGSMNAHTPSFVNNVFDALSGQSCFEGMYNASLRVKTRGSTSLVPPLDFNAWTPSLANTGIPVANWPTTAGEPFGMLTTPRVALTAFTPGPRTLFIKDAFKNAGVGAPSDYSPHDHRLSPSVSPDAASPGSHAPLNFNPLVDRGIDGGPGFTETITMENNRVIPGIGPGLPIGDEDLLLTGWDFDGEGFGNLRRVDAPAFPNPPDNYGVIDIGADELGELIVAGYIDGTRIFRGRMDLADISHRHVYFFHLANSGPHPRPQSNTILGRGFGWYPHANNPTDIAVAGVNYTAGTPGSLRAVQIALTPPATPRRWFMRNLECDFSPHLIMDPHSFWPGIIWTVDINKQQDVYASNPWYRTDLVSAPTGDDRWLTDNPSLYNNFGLAPHSTANVLPPAYGFFTSTGVLMGTLNPPGTYYPLNPQQWVISPTFQFGPYGACANTPLTTYSTRGWGFNDTPAGCPDELTAIPSELDRGRRFNCEVGPGQSNLQTFLFTDVPGPDTGPGLGITAAPPPPLEAGRRAVRDGGVFIRSRWPRR